MSEASQLDKTSAREENCLSFHSSDQSLERALDQALIPEMVKKLRSFADQVEKNQTQDNKYKAFSIIQGLSTESSTSFEQQQMTYFTLGWYVYNMLQSSSEKGKG
jgi:hypothetical protein